MGLGDAATQAVVQVAERYRKPTLIIDASATTLTEGQPAAAFRLAPAQPMLAAKRRIGSPRWAIPAITTAMAHARP